MRPDGQRQSFVASVSNALRGIFAACRLERNFPFDCAFSCVPIALGFAFHISLSEWLAIIVCIGMVLGFELINTALETVVDLASPDMNELAGRAMDCAAGACFIASLCALVVGVILFAPRILSLMGLW